jgi:hypothetical protein
MLAGRFHLSGMFAVLLALMAQLGMGTSVPRIDITTTVAALCHAEDEAGGAPSRAPAHSTDCLICPLCGTLHAQSTALVTESSTLTPPIVLAVVKSELPPPSTAPPALHRPPSQPRAPPTVS